MSKMVRTFRGDWIIFDLTLQGLVSEQDNKPGITTGRCSNLKHAKKFNFHKDAVEYMESKEIDGVLLSSTSIDVPWDYVNGVPT